MINSPIRNEGSREIADAVPVMNFIKPAGRICTFLLGNWSGCS